MNVDDALANADTGADPCVSAQTLAAEVRRFRAAVERVKALDSRHYSSAPLYRDDVLRILEATDD